MGRLVDVLELSGLGRDAVDQYTHHGIVYVGIKVIIVPTICGQSQLERVGIERKDTILSDSPRDRGSRSFSVGASQQGLSRESPTYPDESRRIRR